MSVIIDIIVILLIALFTFIGYKQGLVKAAIRLLSFFIAIVVALILYKPISNAIIDNTSIDDNIKNTIIEKIKPEGVEQDEPIEIEEQTGITNKIIGETNNTIEQIANTFAIKLIEVCVLILIFIVIKIILRFITALADLITKLPILKQANKLGGTVYGLIRGIFIVYVLLAAIYLVSPLMNKNVTNTINDSIITKQIYNNNVLLNIIF